MLHLNCHLLHSQVLQTVSQGTCCFPYFETPLDFQHIFCFPSLIFLIGSFDARCPNYLPNRQWLLSLCVRRSFELSQPLSLLRKAQSTVTLLAHLPLLFLLPTYHKRLGTWPRHVWKGLSKESGNLQEELAGCHFQRKRTTTFGRIHSA